MDQPQIDIQAAHVLAKQAALRAVKRQIQMRVALSLRSFPQAGSAPWRRGIWKLIPNSFRKS